MESDNEIVKKSVWKSSQNSDTLIELQVTL